jgi:hypothetical protein
MTTVELFVGRRIALDEVGPVRRAACPCGIVLLVPVRSTGGIVERLVAAHRAYPEHRAYVDRVYAGMAGV